MCSPCTLKINITSLAVRCVCGMLYSTMEQFVTMAICAEHMEHDIRGMIGILPAKSARGRTAESLDVITISSFYKIWN